MSDRRAGWLLVIVSGALALVVCVLAYGQVVAQSILESSSNSGQAAIDLLLAALPGILMVVALDVIAFFIGRDLWVRVVAALVAVLTVVGVLVAGAIAAESADPPASAYWAAAGHASGPFDCAALNSDTPAEMQAALDELEHPWPVDIYFAADDSCAAMLRGIPTDQVVADYASQLEDAGWAIDTQDEGWLYAERGGYLLIVNSCYYDEPETVIGIFANGDFDVSCEPADP
jgi:hypothetical protein